MCKLQGSVNDQGLGMVSWWIKSGEEIEDEEDDNPEVENEEPDP